MNKETLEILNDKNLLKIKEDNFKRLTNLFNGKEYENAFILNGVYGYSKSKVNPYKEPEKWVEDALEALAETANELRNEVMFRPLCLEFGPYGVHFIDKMLSSEVFFQNEQWYNRYLKTPIGNLHYPDLEKDETWKLAKRVAKAFLSHNVKLPIFGLPTIASPLNIAVNLYGEEILVEMYGDEDAAKHDLRVINDLLCTLHRWYIENIPADQLQPVISGHRTEPYGFGQICGCTTQLLSPELYNEFVAPLDDELLSVYPNGGLIHLCGSHTQHIPTWKNMKSLRAVQLNDRAAEDLEIYFKELREDQIIYLNPFEGMTIERAMNITGGHRLVIVADVKQPIKIK